MKLKYILPFLILFGYQKTAEAQAKAEGNSRNIDLRTNYGDVFLRNNRGLDDLVNLQGGVQLQYRDNALYLLRNGILNHVYGGNMNLGFARAYYNQSEQRTKDQTRQVQDSPIGEITTETTILNEETSRDLGVSLNYGNFFLSYESSINRNNVDGNVKITIDGEQQSTIFSSASNTTGIVYGAGFRNGFFKFFQNRYQSSDQDTTENEGRLTNYLVNANYSIGFADRQILRMDAYYSEGFSGLLRLNLFRDIDLNLLYDEGGNGFTTNISSSNYSELNHRDFERGIENRLRASPRIYDTDLESTRRYLNDMFFTRPFSYDFSVSLNEGNVDARVNVNLRYVLGHYSRGSQSIGAKFHFLIGEYDFKQKEARFGIFLGRRRD